MTFENINLDINDLNDYNIVPNQYINLTGTATGDIRIENHRMPHFQASSIIDFSNASINNQLNFKIINSANIICYKPKLDMTGRSDTSMQMEKNSISCILVEPDVTGGANGIRTTSGATKCMVYRGSSYEADTDAYTAHKNADGICGDSNYFIECVGKTADAGGEEVFDNTSGNDHVWIDCQADPTHLHGLMNVGRGSSATVINPVGLGAALGGATQILNVKWVKYCNIVGGQGVTRFALREQEDDSVDPPVIRTPQNVRWYGAPPVDLRNPDGMNLDDFYRNDPYALFEIPIDQRVDMIEKINFIKEVFYSS